MLLRRPQLPEISHPGRQGSSASSSRQTLNPQHLCAYGVSDKKEGVVRWGSPGLRMLRIALLAFLSVLLTRTENMEAFLRPAAVYPPLLQVLQKGPLRVSLVGSGNWGTAVGKIIAANAKDSYLFQTDVRMWVFEEEFEGRKLTDWINNHHENKKYLPGFQLPPNLRAVPSLVDACKDADLLVFVMPHQFVERTCKALKQAQLLPPHARAISLIKGLGVKKDWPVTLTHEIGNILGVPKPCILSGANVANDVASEHFAEATIGHPEGEAETAALWQLLFDRPNFKVNVLPDVEGVEVCGALKNVIAVAGGICEGLGQGTNTKAAILRLGVEEMKTFIMVFFGDFLADTLYDSAGYADVITTVFGGRNARVSAEFVRQSGKKDWDQLEKEMLNGQKLQGPATLELVAQVIRANQVEDLFPLFMNTYAVAFEGAPPQTILDAFRTTQPRRILRNEDCVKLKMPTLVREARNKIVELMKTKGMEQNDVSETQHNKRNSQPEPTCPKPQVQG